MKRITPEHPSDMCMMCCTADNITATEHEPAGRGNDVEEFWVYCSACDCWTAHPVSEEERIDP